MEELISKSKILIHTFIKFSLFPVVLFWPAGTVNWPEAWIILLIFTLGIGYNIIWLIKNNPALLKERLNKSIQKDQKKWDKILVVVMMIFAIVWIPLPGLDYRYGWSNMPLILEISGFVALLPSLYIIARILQENTFLSPVVRIQKERGHKVIDTGPYKYVRHPMYAVGVIMFIAWPLALGSWITLLLAPLWILIIVIRTYFEDKTLFKELDGYVDYTNRVKYRIIPGVW